MDDKSLTVNKLKEILEYDPETGLFRWLSRPHGRSRRRGGDLAGGTSSHGYNIIRINYRALRAHRLAWLYMTGEWPNGIIDHLNRIRDDNRWSNLRLATHSENQRNRSFSRRNKSGAIGVHLRGKSKRWHAQINIWLGSFDTKEEAVKAREDAEKLLWEGRPLPYGRTAPDENWRKL